MRLIIIWIGLLLSSLGHASPQKFSEIAWKKMTPFYQKILHHPFNQELAQGNLPREKFRYYKEQDALYLKEFAKALGVLSVKVEDPKVIEKLLQFANDCLKEVTVETSGTRMHLANVGYTSFLLATATYKSPEELAAALLPCFWVYLKVAEDLKARSKETNPYDTWFKAYSSLSYRQDVEAMIVITDTLAKKTDGKTIEKMLHAFEVAMQWEKAFWDAAYSP